MTDSQAGLGQFGEDADTEAGDDSDARPDEEATAVAGAGQGRVSDVIDREDVVVPDSQGTVELMVTAVDYTVEGTGAEEYPVVHVFGRRADDTPEHVRVLGVEPYFYVPTADVADRDLVEAYDAILDTREEGPDGERFESIRGEPVTKVVARTPRDVGGIRDDFDRTYEADILFPNRFLIDHDVTAGLRVEERRLSGDDDPARLQVTPDQLEPCDADADIRVNTFDIEVDDRSGFPEDGEEPIVCLTSHDNYQNEYITWLYDAPVGGVDAPTALDGYEQIGDRDDDVEVRTFAEEDAMLDAFIAYVAETDPDVLTGWNFEDFDAPYFMDRCEELDAASEYDLSPDRLSRVNETWRSGWGGPDVKGRVVFDLLYAYQRTQFTELESYRLDAVGELELDAGKERYTGDIGDLWEQEPERLLEYNVRDVELCVEIDRKQEIVAFWDDARRFVGCQLEDAPTPGDAVDMYVLHNAFGEFVLPTKGQQGGEEFEGGAVFEPISGVEEMVSVLDLKSLYPMCMVTINASPETIVDDPDSFEGETYRAPNGTRFRKEPDGMMREMVDELLTERERLKGERDEHSPGSDAYEQYDRQQASVKVIMNSLYGVSGWDRFRLYDKDNAAAITAMGRRVIEFTEEAAREIDHQVMYGDSVTGDRPVVVRDPDRRVRITPIEDLFARSEPKNDLLITTDGGPVGRASAGKDRGTLDGWEALSLADDGESEWRPIEEVVRHEVDEPVVRLQHKFGESTTTRDHSYVVDEDGSYVEATPEEIEEPLRIPGVPDVDTVDTIDVYDVLDGYTREYQDGRSVGAENAVTKTKAVHTDDEYVWFGHENHGELDSTVKVRRHIDLDGEDGRALVRLLAAYVTEGSASTVETTDSKFGVGIAESRREWLEGLERDYRRLFENATTSVIESDSSDERTVTYETATGESEATYEDRTRKLQMMNELSAVFFREFAGQTSRGKRIPSFVFHLPDRLQELFLDVLIEGDGSREFPRYSEEYCERNFDFETTSRELAAGVSMLLIQRRRKHSLKYRDSKDSYTVRTCDYYRTGREPQLTEVEHDGYVYDLSVVENENFVDGVGGLVLHNTDSVMLALGGDVSAEAAIEQSSGIEQHINGRYDDFASEELDADEHRFEIEFEKLYRRFFQAGKKKRYAGHIVWKEGKDVDDIDITGFEYKRSDIAPVTKRVQKRVIEMIVYGEDTGAIADYLHGEIQTFLDGEADLDDVGIPGGIGKRLEGYETDTAQVRGAKYANRMLGTNFQRGSKPKRLYLEKVHPDFWARMEEERGLDPQTDPLYGEFKRDPDVICFEYADEVPEEFAVDWEKMLDKTLKGPIARIIESLGMSWEEVKSGQEQTGLGSFM
ncbi:hypothetical protein BRC97_04530 [Halobacteriales archaeon QS_6_71_20]|nr:MAG: hypothetical protein BRC97_04530 [Halobacteriales archaeon QS_6_71_20]